MASTCSFSGKAEVFPYRQHSSTPLAAGLRPMITCMFLPLSLLALVDTAGNYLTRIVLIGLISLFAHADPVKLAPGLSPADNPLKGLVPYSNPKPGCFPHSMEFNYICFADLMTGPESFDWRALEELLDGIASRGNQTVFRIWIEYPGRKSGLPKFLRDQGVKVTEWENTSEKPPQNICFSPDYEDERLIGALENFIAAFGMRYDGDARIGYITAGLLGSWGEWHSYPREDLFASINTQKRVFDAYEKAFKKTPILLRYPIGVGNSKLASNAGRPFGYHDDSFAWATLDTGNKQDSWYFMPILKAAGDAALNKWRIHPIGGEVRPEVWGQVHDVDTKHEKAQDFLACVEETHVTWLMESGIFEVPLDAVRRERAISHVRCMGYDFHVSTADIVCEGNDLKVGLTVINQGVAPFYHDWPLELAALDNEGNIAKRWSVDWKLTGLLPEDSPREWRVAIPLEAKITGHTLALRVINPLENGKPLRFANSAQEAHAPSWLSLGKVPAP